MSIVNLLHTYYQSGVITHKIVIFTVNVLVLAEIYTKLCLTRHGIRGT